MPAEVKKEIELEIAHVLFLDIVGYSKLSVNEQHAQVEELNEIVRLCEQFRKAEAANRLLKIPTGDGMALVFYKCPRGDCCGRFVLFTPPNALGVRHRRQKHRRPALRKPEQRQRERLLH